MKTIAAAWIIFFPLLWRGAGGEVSAQAAGGWNLKLAEVNKVFVENKGQFSARLPGNQAGNAVEYGVRYNGVEMYFTKSGITFRHDKLVPLSEAEMEERKQQSAKKENQFGQQPQFLNMTWIGANPHVRVTAEQAVSNYFTYYGSKDYKTIHANAFKKITYKNLYPYVDVEYTFSAPSSSGIAGEGLFKYNIILHPGADPSAVQMHYTGAEKMYLDTGGNVTVTSAFGNFTDHAPVTYDATGLAVSSAFVLKENTVSFLVDARALSPRGKVGEGLITIDPWVQLPGFPGGNYVYDIDWDYQGNVYAFGGSAFPPYQLIKLNSAGAIQWTAQSGSASSFTRYGDFAVDRLLGNSYVCEAVFPRALVSKLDSNGNILVDYYNPLMNEHWRIAYNSFTHSGVIGGGGTSNTYQAATFDAGLSNVACVNVLFVKGAAHDIALLAIDDSSCYLLAADPFSSQLQTDNKLIKCTLPGLAAVYSNPGGYHFRELDGIYSYGNGYNGMAKSKRYVYTYDGATLKKWNPLNGTIIKTITVSTDTTWAHGGIAADECDESLYLGVGSSVQKYDSTLTPVASFTTTGNVYDVALAAGGNLVACGENFVASLAVSSALSSFTLNINTTQSTCAGNDGSATADVTGGSPPFSYLWTKGGQTTSGITGLAPGKYPVMVSKYDSSGCTLVGIKTDTALITSSSGFTGQSNSVTNSCIGQNNGTATENAAGGIMPFTYLWRPGGQTTQTATGLAAGDYTVTVKDAAGCQTVDKLKLPGTRVVATTVMEYNGNCGGEITVFQNGGIPPYTFLWNTGDTSRDFSVSAAGTYSVIVKDANSCMDTASVTVEPDTALRLALSPNLTICRGETVVLTAVGAGNYPPVSYTWLPSAGLSVSTWMPPPGYDLSWGSAVTALPALTTTYSIIAVSGLCISDTTIRVTVSSPDSIPFISGNVTITLGQSTVLSASEGTYYTWLPSYGLSCTGCAIPTAAPSQTTTYTLTITDGNGCTATGIVTVLVVCGGNVFVPTAFSPNSDGANDVLYLKNDCIKELDFKIYDRWGNRVFQAADINEGWDGTYEGKPMDPAVFVYYINAVLFSGKTISEKGNISLIK